MMSLQPEICGTMNGKTHMEGPHCGTSQSTGQKTTLGASREKSLLLFKGRWVPPAWAAQHGFGTPVDKEEMPLEF